MYLSEQAETLIKQDFLKDDRSIGAVSYTHLVMRGMDQPEPEQETEHGHTWGDMTL